MTYLNLTCIYHKCSSFTSELSGFKIKNNRYSIVFNQAGTGTL